MTKKETDLEGFVPRYVIVETFWAHGESSIRNPRVRPIPEEGFSPYVRVQCSNRMSKKYPVGTRFRLYFRTRDAKDGNLCLCAHDQAPYEVISIPKTGEVE